jgi:hypothetical protein
MGADLKTHLSQFQGSFGLNGNSINPTTWYPGGGFNYSDLVKSSQQKRESKVKKKSYWCEDPSTFNILKEHGKWYKSEHETYPFYWMNTDQYLNPCGLSPELQAHLSQFQGEFSKQGLSWFPLVNVDKIQNEKAFYENLPNYNQPMNPGQNYQQNTQYQQQQQQFQTYYPSQNNFGLNQQQQSAYHPGFHNYAQPHPSVGQPPNVNNHYQPTTWNP